MLANALDMAELNCIYECIWVNFKLNFHATIEICTVIFIMVKKKTI